MDDGAKTKAQLIEELAFLRQQIAGLEAAQARPKLAEARTDCQTCSEKGLLGNI
jgi:hypothetical protein